MVDLFIWFDLQGKRINIFTVNFKNQRLLEYVSNSTCVFEHTIFMDFCWVENIWAPALEETLRVVKGGGENVCPFGVLLMDIKINCSLYRFCIASL